MLTHKQVWHAIDRLAEEHKFSPSGLARRAGLDPTTFNVSKRISRDGKPRWPSTESVSKVLEATGATIEEFVALITETEPIGSRVRVPIIGMAEAGSDGYFDDGGYPLGSGWDEVAFPDIPDTGAYALEVSGDSMSPLYRDGDVIIVSPSSGVRRGDRVVVRTRDGEIMVKQLTRRTASRIELHSLNPQFDDRILAIEEIDWMARIIWASQ